MAAVEHALPNDNALRVSEVEVTFIIQVHPVGPLTKRKVSSAGPERCVFEKIARPRIAIDVNRRDRGFPIENLDFTIGLQLGSATTSRGCHICPAGRFHNS
jgi:uncharacterized pyridoxal phosphate-containing UPF0001 family protein